MKPDPYASEETVEIDATLHAKWLEAATNAKQWQQEADRLKAALVQEIGDAYAGTINGYKLITYRPEERYAVARLRKDYPELTEIYVAPVTSYEFDMERFRKAHADLADQYRVRSFRSLGEV